jgi:hypothetical protein
MMTKKYFINLTSVLLLIVVSSLAIAQVPKKSVVKPVTKFKPPVVKTYLGNTTGKAATTGVEEAKNLITLPIKIADDKNVTYALSSYQFVYKRIGITEDEETGKTSPESDIVSNQFTDTPLPAIWQSNIKETLHKGEELYFFDIIAFDKQGRRFFAPELKITVQ